MFLRDRVQIHVRWECPLTSFRIYQGNHMFDKKVTLGVEHNVRCCCKRSEWLQLVRLGVVRWLKGIAFWKWCQVVTN